MSEKVVRYNLTLPASWMEERVEGEYVHHSDYEALEKYLTTLNEGMIEEHDLAATLQARVKELEAEVKDHEQWAQRMMDDPKSEPYVKLLTENKRLQEALAIAGIPLEALAATECDANAWTIDKDLQHQILDSVEAIRAALKEKP